MPDPSSPSESRPTTTLRRRPPALPSVVESRRKLMAAWGQKPGEFPFKKGFVGIVITPLKSTAKSG
jgi:hypothetical protein